MYNPNHPLTPADHMLPNPHIRSAEHPVDLIPEVEAPYFAAIRAEQRALKSGAEIEALPIYSGAIEHAKVARAAVTDKLTGLLNREGLDEWFERYKPKKFGVVFADGDEFGKINKKYSHDVGDEVIRFYAQKVSSKFRVEDNPVYQDLRSHPEDRDAVAVLGGAGVGRFGGDEVVGVVNLSHVKDGEEQAALDTIVSRTDDSDTFRSEDGSAEFPVKISAVGMIGKASDNQPISYYKSRLEPALKTKKKARRAERES